MFCMNMLNSTVKLPINQFLSYLILSYGQRRVVSDKCNTIFRRGVA